MEYQAHLLDILFLAIVNWQMVETYHHGDIFASCRGYWDARGGFVGDLQGCPYCLSHWTAFLCGVVWNLCCRALPGSWIGWAGFLVFLFFESLAVARLSNLGNDLTRRWCRTPGRDFGG